VPSLKASYVQEGVLRTIVAASQFLPVPKDVWANLATVERHCRLAGRAGAMLVVFPELCLTGYLPPEELVSAVRGDLGGAAAQLPGIARRLGIDIAVGLPEDLGDGRLANSMLYFDCNGQLRGTYRKVHLWGTEREWAVPGQELAAFDSSFARIGMWICYDTRFPEVARLLALDGAALGLVATAWLGPANEWELALRARALDNGIYVVGSALQGEYGPFSFHGVSMVVNPHGQVVAAATEGREGVIFAEYDPEVVSAFRARLPLLKDRRTDLFGALCRPADW
jgi:predicted amidohydrolase